MTRWSWLNWKWLMSGILIVLLISCQPQASLAGEGSTHHNYYGGDSSSNANAIADAEATANATLTSSIQNNVNVDGSGGGTTVPEAVGREFMIPPNVPIPQAPHPTATQERPWNVFDNFYKLFGNKRTVADWEVAKIDISSAEAVVDVWAKSDGYNYISPFSTWRERADISGNVYDYVATAVVKCGGTPTATYFRMHKATQDVAGDTFEIVVTDYSKSLESGSWGIGGNVHSSGFSGGMRQAWLAGGGSGYSKAWLENIGSNQALIKIYRKKNAKKTAQADYAAFVDGRR